MDALQEANQREFLEWDTQTLWVWVRKRVSFEFPDGVMSAKQLRGIVRILEDAPDIQLKSRFVEFYKGIIKGLPNGLGKPPGSGSLLPASGSLLPALEESTLKIKAGQVRPARRTQSDPNVSKLIQAYHDTYLLTHESKPPINGAKCGGIAQKLLRGRPYAEAQWMIEEFFRNPPELYAKKNLYGMEHILAASTTLLARSNKPKFSQEPT